MANLVSWLSSAVDRLERPPQRPAATPIPQPGLRVGVAHPGLLNGIAQSGGVAGLQDRNIPASQPSFMNQLVHGIEEKAPGLVPTLKGVGAGIARAGVGAGQAASGLYDLATPGIGTNRFSKDLTQYGRNIDQYAQQNHINPVLYHGAQIVANLVGPGELKAGAEALRGAPRVVETVPKAPSLVERSTQNLFTHGPAGRVAAKTIRGAANPKLAAANAGFTAYGAGQTAAQGQRVSPLDTAASFAIGQVGFPAAGALGGEGVRLASNGVRAAAPLVRKGAIAANDNLNLGRVTTRRQMQEQIVGDLNDSVRRATNSGDKTAARTLIAQRTQEVQLLNRLKKQEAILKKNVGLSIQPVDDAAGEIAASRSNNLSSKKASSKPSVPEPSKPAVVPEGQGQTVYHGTDKASYDNITGKGIVPGTKKEINLGKVMMSKSDVVRKFGNEHGFSVSRNPEVAKGYGEHVVPLYIDPSAKIATAKDFPEVFKQFEDGKYFNMKDAIELAKNNGYDGIDVHSFEVKTPKPSKNEEIQIFNTKVLKTKDQLAPQPAQAAKVSAQTHQPVKKTVLGKVKGAAARAAKKAFGLDTSSYNHTIDNYAVQHAMRDPSITAEDIANIPNIIDTPDHIYNGGKTKQGLDTLVYHKKIGGHNYYVEEVRTGKGELAMKTLNKKKNPDTQRSDEVLYTSPKLTTERSGQSSLSIVPKTGLKVKPALPAPEKPKGVILKEGPIQNGRRDVVRAVFNPETRRLEQRTESIVAPGHESLSASELASLDQKSREMGPHEASAPESTLPSPTTPRRTTPTPAGTVRLSGERSGGQTAAQTGSNTGRLVGPSEPRTQKPSLANDIPDLLDEVQSSKLNVKQKVALHDYLRTPDRVLKKIGLGSEADLLRQAEHNYKQELPKQIEQIKQWRKDVGNSPDASKHIFQYLDGQKVKLTPAEAKVAGEMKASLKQWADRLGIPEEHRITNYITHIFDDTIQGQEFDPDFEKLIADKVPGSVYDPYTEQRLGKKGYIEDAFRSMEAYVKRGVRKSNMDPALEKLSNAAEKLDLHSWNYVKQYGDRINMRPSAIDNLLDNSIKQTPIGYKLGNRPTARLSRAIRQATYRASLGLNVGSAVRNLTQGVNTFAELGSKWTGVGYVKALRDIAEHTGELERVGVMDNGLVEDRVLSAGKQLLQKADQGLFAFFSAAERINRGAAYFGAKARALSEGKTPEDAIKEGVDTARKTQFTFGRVDTPVFLQNDLVKVLTQFQSYNVKQAEFLGEMIKNKEFAKLLRFTGASAVVFGTVGQALGYRPSDMLPGFSIGGAPGIQAPIAVGQAIGKTVTAKDNKSSTRGQQIGKAFMKAGGKVGAATIPGFAQGKKTVTGIRAVQREQVKKGSTNYTIQPTKANYVKGAVFGPYSLNGPKSTRKVTIGTGKDALTLTPVQSDAFNKENDAKYQKFAAQLHQTPQYKSATAAQRKQMDTTLKAQVTKSDKRAYSADHNLSAGRTKPATKAEQAILTGKLPTVKTPGSSGSAPSLAPNLDKQSATTLTKYGSMSATDRAKAFNSTPSAEYQYDLAKYNNDKANGTLTTAQDIKTKKTLAKEKVGSVYPKNVRDLYSLSKADLYNYLSTPDGKTDKVKIGKQLIAYDQALYNAGLTQYLKFKTGLAPSKGGSRGGSGRKGGSSAKYDPVAAAKLKFDLARKPLKIVGSLPAPTKLAAPKFVSPALKKVYQKQGVNTRPTVSVTKTKRLA